jgi:hypothetical protein
MHWSTYVKIMRLAFRIPPKSCSLFLLDFIFMPKKSQKTKTNTVHIVDVTGPGRVLTGRRCDDSFITVVVSMT